MLKFEVKYINMQNKIYTIIKSTELIFTTQRLTEQDFIKFTEQNNKNTYIQIMAQRAKKT